MEKVFENVVERDRSFVIVGFGEVTSAIGFVGLKDWDERARTAQQVAGSLFPQFMGICRADGLPGHTAAAGPE